jgi:hypothetical protein
MLEYDKFQVLDAPCGRSLQTADRAVAERRLRKWLEDLDARAWGIESEDHKVGAEMSNEIDDFISRMKEGDSFSFDMDAKGRAVHIIAEAIQQMRHEGLSKIDIAKTLSHAASVLVGRENDWKWEWGE